MSKANFYQVKYTTTETNTEVRTKCYTTYLDELIRKVKKGIIKNLLIIKTK